MNRSVCGFIPGPPHPGGVDDEPTRLAVLQKPARQPRLEGIGSSYRRRKIIDDQPLRDADDMRVIRLGTVMAHEDQNIGCRRHRVGALGEGLRPAPRSLVRAMSRRQSERTSRFQAQIESGIGSAALAFRDNDVEASITTAVRLWWTSRL